MLSYIAAKEQLSSRQGTFLLSERLDKVMENCIKIIFKKIFSIWFSFFIKRKEEVIPTSYKNNYYEGHRSTQKSRWNDELIITFHGFEFHRGRGYFIRPVVNASRSTIDWAHILFFPFLLHFLLTRRSTKLLSTQVFRIL